MAWPTTAVTTGDTITAAQLNLITTKILEIEVTADTVASVDLQGIPAHFRHLMVRMSGRGDLAAASAGLQLRLNADESATYQRQYVAHNTGTDAGSELFNQTSASIGYVPAANASSNSWGQIELLIPNYAGGGLGAWISRANHVETATGTPSAHAGIWIGVWDSTAAIDEISLFAASGNLIKGTNVQLFGMP